MFGRFRKAKKETDENPESSSSAYVLEAKEHGIVAENAFLSEDWGVAEESYRLQFRTLQKFLKFDHQESLQCIVKLVQTLEAQNKIEEGKSLIKQANDIMRKKDKRCVLFGQILVTQAILEKADGNLAEARDLIIAAIPVLTKTIGPDNPLTQKATNMRKKLELDMNMNMSAHNKGVFDFV